jgi:hypothetical protein
MRFPSRISLASAKSRSSSSILVYSIRPSIRQIDENAFTRRLRLGPMLVVAVALWVQPANAIYFNYTEWDAARSFPNYVHDWSLDSLVSFANADTVNVAQHNHCIGGAHMSNGQLAMNILNYAKDEPVLHNSQPRKRCSTT